jgi:hypothetical protein
MKPVMQKSALGVITHHQQCCPKFICSLPLPESALFLYHCTRKENNVKFMHQKSVQFAKVIPPCSDLTWLPLRHSPHLTENSILKYLPPSPATSKGHMRCLKKGLHSPTLKTASLHQTIPMGPLVHMEYNKSNADSHNWPTANIINDIDDHLIAKVSCFGAFVDKVTGVAYYNCTGNFPFVSLNGKGLSI